MMLYAACWPLIATPLMLTRNHGPSRAHYKSVETQFDGFHLVPNQRKQRLTDSLVLSCPWGEFALIKDLDNFVLLKDILLSISRSNDYSLTCYNYANNDSRSHIHYPDTNHPKGTRIWARNITKMILMNECSSNITFLLRTSMQMQIKKTSAITLDLPDAISTKPKHHREYHEGWSERLWLSFNQ
jgi:hypothetical protein